MTIREEKREYLRKLDIRVKRWVRMEFPHLSKEKTNEMIEKLISEGEKIYDEVTLILNREE